MDNEVIIGKIEQKIGKIEQKLKIRRDASFLSPIKNPCC
jgi:hypothetical protein